MLSTYRLQRLVSMPVQQEHLNLTIMSQQTLIVLHAIPHVDLVQEALQVNVLHVKTQLSMLLLLPLLIDLIKELSLVQLLQKASIQEAVDFANPYSDQLENTVSHAQLIVLHVGKEFVPSVTLI